MILNVTAAMAPVFWSMLGLLGLTAGAIVAGALCGAPGRRSRGADVARLPSAGRRRRAA